MFRKVGKIAYFVLMPLVLLVIGMMLGDTIHFNWFKFIHLPDNLHLHVFFDAAVLEETLKWIPAVLLVLAGTHPYFIVFIGLGFGIEEMWMHYWYDNAIMWLDPIGHLLFALVMAEFLRLAFATRASKPPQGRAKFYKLILASLLVPITLHGAHNFLGDMVYLVFLDT